MDVRIQSPGQKEVGEREREREECRCAEGGWLTRFWVGEVNRFHV